jgi:hypothetical protein
VATPVQVAASACLVASGLFMCGLGGALAFADPGHGHSNGSAGEPNRDSQSDSDRRGDRDGDDSSKRHARDVNESRTDPKDPPPDTKPTEPTKPTPCPDPEPPGQPPREQGSGGGGGGGFEPPRGRPEPPPAMRLPTPREVEPGGPPGPDPAVIDAGAPPVAAAGLPVEPITMPVIVSPPAGLGSGAPGGPSGPGLPGPPRGVPAEPPAGRERLPANIGSSAASYRIGYTEYLRAAGLPQVAALAVPGVGGILVLTGAGGFVGYRQAKAGHAVRSGSARFMN